MFTSKQVATNRGKAGGVNIGNVTGYTLCLLLTSLVDTIEHSRSMFFLSQKGKEVEQDFPPGRQNGRERAAILGRDDLRLVLGVLFLGILTEGSHGGKR